MDCDKATELIMSYMDNTMIPSDAEALSRHIESCPSCKEDFAVYDDIIKGFSDMELFEAPEGFEAKVMEKINSLEPIYDKNRFDNIWCAVWGAFSILLGLGAIVSINSAAILEYLSASVLPMQFVDTLIQISLRLDSFTAWLGSGLSETATQLGSYLNSIRYFFIAVLSVLVAVQVYIYRKDKVEA